MGGTSLLDETLRESIVQDLSEEEKNSHVFPHFSLHLTHTHTHAFHNNDVCFREIIVLF